MKYLIFLVIALIGPLSASADCPCNDCNPPASSPQDVFDRACRQQGGVPHGCSCDAAGAGEGGHPRFMSPEAVVFSLHATGAAVGLLGGTFFKSPNDQSYWAEGAAEGIGLLGLTGLALNADNFSTPATVAIAAVDGAFIGAGYGHYRALEFVEPGAAPVDEVSKTATGAAVGAAVGATVGFVLKSLTTSSQLRTFFSTVRFEATSRRLGVGIVW